MSNSIFKSWIEVDGELGQEFKTAKKKYALHKQLVTRLRDELGAHAEQHIGEAINRFEPDEQSSIEIHTDDMLRPHVATRILVNAILKNTPRADENAELERVIISVNEATRCVLNALICFLHMYAKRYPLFPI